MHDGNARRSWEILGVAGAGLLLGHWLTYLVDVSDQARDQVLRATGHGYLSTAGRLAAVVAAVSLAVVFLGRLTRHGQDVTFRSTAVRLAVVQAAAFVGLEVLERMGAGASMQDLTTILPVGVVAQAIVALAGAWLIRAVLRSADLVSSILRAAPLRPPGIIQSTVHVVHVLRPRPWAGSRFGRAPPLPS
jgi:hypothetical protein